MDWRMKMTGHAIANRTQANIPVIWGSESSRSRLYLCTRCSTCGQTPFEPADITSNTCYDWMIGHAYIIMAAQAIVETLKDFRPAQKAASFTIDQALDRMTTAASAGPRSGTRAGGRRTGRAT